MLLDFHANTKAFTLSVDRHEADVRDLMTVHGLDLSAGASGLSTPHKAVLYTYEPYAAVAFFNHATAAAKAELTSIQGTINRSWAVSSTRHVDVPADKELSPFQVAGVDYVLSQGNTLIGDQPGLGKAAPLWSKVLTPRGWREIGSLAEGDSICTSYGKQARITGVFDRGVMQVWKVAFNDGAVTYCSEDHLWKVRTHGPSEPHWFVAPLWEVAERLRRGQRLQVPIAEPHWGVEGPPPVSAYLVGLLLGDGGLSIRSRIMLSSADQEIISRCKIIARYYGAELVHHSRVDWRFNACAGLRKRLGALGMMGHKSGTKRVPARYLQGSRKVRLDTLQGLMDSDGWCTAQGDSGFASTSEGLADDVISLVRSLGGVARKSVKPGSWSISVNMPTCPFWLARKAERWQPYETYKPARWIRSIEPHSIEPVRCISVASKDRLYITDDYVVTHNTMQAIAVANEMQAERVLVLCPANIRLQWCERIRSWTTLKYPYTVYPILHGRRGVHPTAEWTVISYDLARSETVWRALAKGKYDLLILDEAHYLKTIDARRTRTVFGGGVHPAAEALASRSNRILGLTGTPLPNRPREAYTLARGLCLGADTRVLTHCGVKPITAVLKTDLLWDGEQWVGHDGIIAKGCKPTLRAAGLSATPGHQVSVGGGWSIWQSVLENGDIQSRALATGLESLRSLAIFQEKAASVLSSNVPAEAIPIASHSLTSEGAKTSGAKHAAIGVCLIRQHAIALGLLIRDYGDFFSPGSQALSDDVKIRMMAATAGMAAEAFAYTRNGWRIADSSSPISVLCPAAESLDLSLIAEITNADTSPATSGGSPRPSTLGIRGQFRPSPSGCRNLRRVFDIVNAGPRQRFTVLTDAGPLVVHNCWDAIDWMSEDRFTTRFNPSEQREIDTQDGVKTYIDERSGRHHELQARLRANFMVRRLKRDVLPQLKIPYLDIVHVEETGAIKQALAAEKLLDIDPEDMTGLDMSVRGQVSTVRRMMGLAMAPLAADYIAMLLEGGEEKICVFAWHIEVLDILMAKLAKYRPLRIDGSTPPTRKPALVAQFARAGHRLLIGNILSMGTGTDGLQEACQRGVAAEASWVSGDNEQMVDRLDRMGQSGQVLFDFLVAPGSFSEHVLGSSLRKRKVTHTALDQRLDDW